MSRAEERLKEALARLLNGKPAKVKVEGRLTLNKVNNEAGLGNSYIHKFPDFVVYAKPLIEEYNHNRDKAMLTGLDIEVGAPLSELEKLRCELVRITKLKDKYRIERDNAIEARKKLETENQNLLFRCYELQEEVKKEYEIL